MAEREQVVYEFGPFQLDVSQRLLFRDRKLIPVSPKATETLVVLVKNHGQLVEKEALIRQIWPGSFVEESNLAVQVSQLRKILSEAMGRDPIETIPKRGYRFIAAVQKSTAIDAPPVAAVPPEPTAPPPAPRAARARPWMMILGLAALLLALLLAFLGIVRWRTTPAPPAATIAAARPLAAATGLTAKDSILLADIQNETGESVFDGTLRQALSIQLEQSPFLALVSDQQIQRTLSLMQQPKNVRLTPELAWELCQRTASAAVIYGSVANLGNQYILGLRALNCRTGDSLVNQQTTAEGKDHVLKAVDEAATALRAKLGESLAQLQKYNTPIEEATTPSLSALEAYSVGWLMNYRKGDPAGAIAFFQRAIQLDPGFAMAYAALGQSYSNLYEPGHAAQYLKRAYELRERVSEREKFYIESRYQRLVTGDLEKARQIHQQWAQVYPRDAVPYTSLGLIDRYLGQYQRALTEAAQALQLSPDSAQSYTNLSFSYLLLNRLAEAKALADEAQSKNLDSPLLRLNLYFQAYLRNDRPAAEQLEAWSVGRAGIEHRFLEDRAFQYASAGQLDQALALSKRAIASALRSGAKETAAAYQIKWAVLQALIGNGSQARQDAAAGLRLADDRDSKYNSALAFALSGESARAQVLVESLDKAFPQDTAVQFCYLPTLRALLALARGDAAQALQSLEATKPYELGEVTVLYPVYVRGQAYLAAQRGADAASEFQKIIDWPGVVSDDPIGALAHLQLARAYAMQGSIEKARTAYRDFLTRWQDAPPTIPILVAARSEYAHMGP